ncbi:MAG: sugar ABC transporter substrate-binding protein [Chloroflexi bacterium]|nr:MAG: sugar ABC transporter substrate-binding protein [Chloroflexota bacterium]
MVLLLIASLLLAACGATAESPGGTGDAAASTAGATGDTAASDVPPPGSAAPAAPATGENAVTIRYALWDANQLPAYQECAAAFSKKNPNIAVEIQQLGWDDYWSNIQTGMVGGTAPDVFTNHLAKYPEFANKEQLVDIQPLLERDGVDTEQYIGDLAELWSREGKRYGLPKDWDTVSLAYNKDMLDKAGADVASLQDLTWNPQDGGTFQQLIAQLTIDANGKNGLDPAFDKNNVVQYGFIPQGSGAPFGQEQWSWLAASTGFNYIDQPWGTNLHFEDPRIAQAIQWYADLHLKHGFAPPYADYETLGGDAIFQAGKGALTTAGSWKIGDHTSKAQFPVGFAPLPAGPEGRKSMFNGLADSITIGSQHQNEAWEWVKFLASPECKEIVGTHGVVFPAIQSGVDKALAAYKEKGVDVSSFTEIALDPEATFLFPISDNASQISAILDPTLDSIMLGDAQAADALQQADQEIDALFQ